MKYFRYGSVWVLLSYALLQPAYALDWSRTELHFQYGNLAVPTFAGGGDAEHFIYTLQHASGWQYGDNYFLSTRSMPRIRSFRISTPMANGTRT